MSKQSGKNQRALIDRKLSPWLSVREDRTPPSGWLKAIRGALGISTRQLAERAGVAQAAVLQFEKREAEGTVSLESIEKLAKAMRCKLVYAIVPEDSFAGLESVLDEQAIQAARAIVSKVDHSMRLEQQGLSPAQSAEQVKELARQLKEKMDPSLWGKSK